MRQVLEGHHCPRQQSMRTSVARGLRCVRSAASSLPGAATAVAADAGSALTCFTAPSSSEAACVPHSLLRTLGPTAMPSSLRGVSGVRGDSRGVPCRAWPTGAAWSPAAATSAVGGAGTSMTWTLRGGATDRERALLGRRSACSDHRGPVSVSCQHAQQRVWNTANFTF